MINEIEELGAGNIAIDGTEQFVSENDPQSAATRAENGDVKTSGEVDYSERH